MTPHSSPSTLMDLIAGHRVTAVIHAGDSTEETVKTIRVRECRVNLTDLW
jgi:hypothetical protein